MAPPGLIRIALVEDTAEHVQALRAVLLPEHGFHIAAEFASAETGLADIPSLSPDLVLMDVHLGGMNGIECIWTLKQSCPSLPIIVCTALESEDLVLEAIAAGASGYVIKHDPPHLIRAVLANVAAGCFSMSRSVARDLQQFFKTIESADRGAVHLSPREKQVLRELADGYRDKEISDHLGITLSTLRTYTKSTYEKLHVTTRTEAAAKYWQSRAGRFQRLTQLIERIQREKSSAR